jgi:hypothetical protein
VMPTPVGVISPNIIFDSSCSTLPSASSLGVPRHMHATQQPPGFSTRSTCFYKGGADACMLLSSSIWTKVNRDWSFASGSQGSSRYGSTTVLRVTPTGVIAGYRCLTGSIQSCRRMCTMTREECWRLVTAVWSAQSSCKYV